MIKTMSATLRSPLGLLSTAAICLTGSILLSSQPSQAQQVPDFSGEPLFGTHNLSAGFTPDPYEVDVLAGGSSDAWQMDLGSSCSGYIAAAQPDVRLNYEANSSWDLTIQAFSSDDTTLVINGPDGRWYCNDDANGLNPAVAFPSPMSGQYDIWVGTFYSDGENGTTPPATVVFTELE